MSSKISGLNTSPSSLGAGRAADPIREPVSGAPASPAAAPGSSEVQITPSAAQLAALVQALRTQPAVDEARVSQLRTAIAEGRYTVQPHLVAERLIQLEQSLGSSPQS